MVLNMDVGGFYGCLSSKALMIPVLYETTPNEHNTFIVAVKCSSTILWIHFLMLVLHFVLSSSESDPLLGHSFLLYLSFPLCLNST